VVLSGRESVRKGITLGREIAACRGIKTAGHGWGRSGSLRFARPTRFADSRHWVPQYFAEARGGSNSCRQIAHRVGGLGGLGFQPGFSRYVLIRSPVNRLVAQPANSIFGSSRTAQSPHIAELGDSGRSSSHSMLAAMACAVCAAQRSHMPCFRARLSSRS
jgi:hypothetical protein